MEYSLNSEKHSDLSSSIDQWLSQSHWFLYCVEMLPFVGDGKHSGHQC